jgi:hypothetical protein
MEQYPIKPQPADPEFPEELLDGPWAFTTHNETAEFLAFAGTRKERQAIKAQRRTQVDQGRREPRRWRENLIVTVGVATVIALLVLFALTCQQAPG